MRLFEKPPHRKVRNSLSGLDELILGDCCDVLPKIKKESVDLILTDPPYGISNNVKITRSKGSKFGNCKDIIHNFGEWDNFKDFNEYWRFTKRWVDLAVPVLRAGGIFVCFFDRDKINFLSCYLQRKYGFKSKGYFAYIKSNPVPQARKVKFMNAWEIAGIWQKPKGKLTFNYQCGQQPDYTILPICSGNERTEHPTQKPLRLMYPFINYYTNEGDVVLDCFAGCGTTAVASYKTGRKFIAIEKSPKFYGIAKERLNNELSQVSIFELIKEGNNGNKG